MSRTNMHGPVGRVVSFYQFTPYERAMEEVERDRDRLFMVVRRAWANPPTEEVARRIGGTAMRSGMAFDEALFWFYEQVCKRGSGSIATLTEPTTLST